MQANLFRGAAILLFLSLFIVSPRAFESFPRHACEKSHPKFLFETMTPDFSFSPDGQKIVFGRGYGSRHQLRMLDLRTGNFTCITSSNSKNSQPSWSPDGKSIVFSSDRTGTAQIHVLSLNSGKIRILKQSRFAQHYPAFSPNGTQIAYVQYENDPRKRIRTLRLMSSDGARDRVLYRSRFGLNHLSWSHDGREIYFFSIEPDGLNDIFGVNVTTGKVARKTNNTITDSYSQTDSPDGLKRSFSQGMEKSAYTRWFNYEMLETDRSTGETKRLTWTWTPNDRQQYSPDGRRIVFASRRTGYAELFSMKADGTGLRQITFQPESELATKFQSGEIKKLGSRFRSLRTKNPNALPFNERAPEIAIDILIGRGQTREALAAAEMFTEVYPKSPRALRTRAFVRQRMGNREALNDYRSAISGEPNEMSVLFQLGEKRYLDLVSKIPGFWSDHANDMNRLAYRLVGIGQPRPAIAIWKKLVSANPNDANLADSLAEGFMMYGDYRSALAYYRRSLDLNPKNTNAAFHISRIENLTDSNAQVTKWARILERRPDPLVVLDKKTRDSILKTGLPWRVADKRTGIEFLLVPPGKYRRGAAADDPYDRANERPQHEVTITQPFYLGRYEVTNKQMRKFRPDFSSGTFFRDESQSLDGDDYPAVDLNWQDAVAFAKHFGFRLPTEAEWEYAARGGVKTRYPWGNDITKGKGWGNIFNQSMRKRLGMDWEPFAFEDGFDATSPIGKFRPNRWGFYDMFGNAWEYTADAFYDDEYKNHASGAIDPIRSDGERKTLRGGGFGNAPRGSGIPYRFGMKSTEPHDGNGFRVAKQIKD